MPVKTDKSIQNLRWVKTDVSLGPLTHVHMSVRDCAAQVLPIAEFLPSGLPKGLLSKKVIDGRKSKK